MIRKLKKQDLKPLYAYMSFDFPANELKPLAMIEKSFDTGFMEGYGLYTEDEQLMAYALFVKIENKLLLDYFAVLPDYRDRGVGSSFLTDLREILEPYEYVIWEVENPDYCDDPEEREVMERRIRFYLRNGVRDTGASGRMYGVEYRFFELDREVQHTEKEARECMEQFYRIYWPEKETYKKHVQMHQKL